MRGLGAADYEVKQLNKKEDLRIKRSKRLLSNALFELIKEKPFEKITVSDICERALVQRATFYSHFADKYELLSYTLDKHIPFKISESSADDPESPGLIEEIITHIDRHREVYCSIVKNRSSETVSDKIQQLLEHKLNLIANDKIQNGGELPVAPEFWSAFYAGACINTVNKWLEGKINITAKELISNLSTLLSVSRR